MPRYEFETVNATGRRARGRESASSIAALVSDLSSRGLTPLDIRRQWWRFRVCVLLIWFGCFWKPRSLWEYAVSLEDYRTDGESPRQAIMEDWSYS